MGDSGRTTQYEYDQRLWRIDHAGAITFVVAETPGDALREQQSVEDDSGCEDFRVRLMPPTESITVMGEDPTDYPKGFLEEDDEFFEGGRIRFTATAAEWCEYVAETLTKSTYYLCGSEF